MRCPDCNKFVGNEEQDPEVESLEVEHDEAGCATVTADVRIVNACAECGTELTEYTFNLETQVQIEPADHKCPAETEGAEPTLDLEVEEESSERTSRTEGKGRGLKTFYGSTVSASVKCRCGKVSASVTLEDDVQASGMDVMV